MTTHCCIQKKYKKNDSKATYLFYEIFIKNPFNLKDYQSTLLVRVGVNLLDFKNPPCSNFTGFELGTIHLASKKLFVYYFLMENIFATFNQILITFNLF